MRELDSISQDEFAFRFADARMRLRRVIEHSPRNQPQESEYAGDNKSRPPATEVFVEANHEYWRDSATDRRTTIKQRHGPTAFLFGKPFRNGFGCCRPVCGFTGAKQEAKE